MFRDDRVAREKLSSDLRLGGCGALMAVLRKPPLYITEKGKYDCIIHTSPYGVRCMRVALRPNTLNIVTGGRRIKMQIRHSLGVTLNPIRRAHDRQPRRAQLWAVISLWARPFLGSVFRSNGIAPLGSF
jgi:hypothetical protein